MLCVPEVGRRDDHRVELFLLVEHLAVILVAVRLVLEPLEAVDDALLVVFGPDVADGAEAEPRDPEHGVGQHLPLRTGAEERDVDHLQVCGRLCGGGDLLDSCLLDTRVVSATRSRTGREPGPSTVPSARRADQVFSVHSTRPAPSRSCLSSVIGQPCVRLPAASALGAGEGGEVEVKSCVSSTIQASTPGLFRHSASISSRLNSMHAVVNASVTAAAAARCSCSGHRAARRFAAVGEPRPTRRGARGPDHCVRGSTM